MAMEFAFLMPIAAAACAIIGGVFAARRRVAAWRYAAQRCGLRHIEEKRGTLGLLRALEGEADGLRVRIESYHRGKSEHGTRLIVDSAGQIPVSLDLRAEGFSSAVEKTFGAKEVEVGDPAFDDGVYVRGAEEQLFARLDPATRSLVLLAVASGGRVIDGSLRVEVRGGRNGEKLARLLETLLATARNLARPTDVLERLIEGLRSDPMPDVRLRCLDLLARKFAGDERARAAFREALGSPSPEMRLRAAVALQKEGQETLVELASSPASEESCAARALAALGASVPVERAASILGEALRSGRRSVAFAAIAALGAARAAAAVSHLAPILTSVDTELGVAAARALAAIGDPAAEPALTAALRSESGEIRLAAADGLGCLGSAAAVAPLHVAVSAHLLDLDLRSAARQAIAEIQSRAPGASPGQISLTEGGEAGQVSLAGENHSGRVTVAEE
jgi:hypothetical protein